MSIKKPISYIFALLAFALTFAAGQVGAQPAPLIGDSVVIAMTLNMVDGKAPEDSMMAMKAVGSYMRKQPGFVDDVLLASTFPGNNPTYVYISRWQTVEDWMSLSAEQDFLALLEDSVEFFDWSSAEVFTPVKE